MRTMCLGALLLTVACGASEDPAASSNNPSGTGGMAAGGGASTGGDSATGGTSSSGGGPSFSGAALVNDAGNAEAGSADLAIAPDGTIYVSWIAANDVYVARSSDGGATFEAPVMVDDASIVPILSMARHPYVAASDDRVAVVFGDQPGTVHLFASATSGPLAFDDYDVIGAEIATPFRDFAKVVFLDDQSMAVAWHGYPNGGGDLFLARENDGFVSAEVTTGSPGLPCECCPLEMVRDDNGDLLVAFRNNVNNTREMWAAQAPGAATFSSFVAVSDTEGTVPTCPMQGPRVSKTADAHVMVWSARGSGPNVGLVHVATSSDGGQSWSSGTPIAGFYGDEPTIAVGSSGTLYVTAVTGNGKSSIASSSDGGQSFGAPGAITVADGDIATPQAESAAGVAALVGVSSAGSVWFSRME